MQGNTTPPIEAQPLTIINGGIEITVKHIDGKEESIKVRQLPLRHMAQYGQSQGDEGKLIELYTQQPPEWVDGLIQESQIAVVELGDRLNQDPFFRWSERRLAANERLLPLSHRVSASAKSVQQFLPGAATPPTSSKA